MNKYFFNICRRNKNLNSVTIPFDLIFLQCAEKGRGKGFIKSALLYGVLILGFNMFQSKYV